MGLSLFLGLFTCQVSSFNWLQCHITSFNWNKIYTTQRKLGLFNRGSNSSRRTCYYLHAFWTTRYRSKVWMLNIPTGIVDACTPKLPRCKNFNCVLTNSLSRCVALCTSLTRQHFIVFGAYYLYSTFTNG